ncbi:hypothetical protein [Endozoicomonas sp. ONNA2]|uniref:hypothetical protein n=1 Tax=Endozoicomonas sp. ONNA2 TaxID=2828741 RepID=UPI002149696D|nr:hypothetical protein [Endozoicomonas sp. ONNA2]
MITNPPAASATHEVSTPVYFRDKCQEREIAVLEVDCLAKDRGCPWSGIMSHFQKVHLRRCHHFLPGLSELKVRVFHDLARQTSEQMAAVVQQKEQALEQLPALEASNRQQGSKIAMLEAKVFSLTERLTDLPATVDSSQSFAALAGLREALVARRDLTVHSLEFSEITSAILSSSRPSLTSEVFTVEDYQMRLILRPVENDDSIHPNPVSGLYVQIVPGEKDLLLPWPRNIALKITVIGKRQSPAGDESENLVRIIDLARAPAHCQIRPGQGSVPVGINYLATSWHLFGSNPDNSPRYVFDDKLTMNVERFYGSAEATDPVLHQIPYSALPFCWPIAHFGEKVAAIRSGRADRVSLSSPCFFTADGRYVMALEFYPAQSSHSSHLDRNRLFVKFLEGSCDGGAWPPSGELQLSVLRPRDTPREDKKYQISLSGLEGNPAQGNANHLLATFSDAILNLFIDQDMLAFTVSYVPPEESPAGSLTGHSDHLRPRNEAEEN